MVEGVVVPFEIVSDLVVTVSDLVVIVSGLVVIVSDLAFSTWNQVDDSFLLLQYSTTNNQNSSITSCLGAEFLGDTRVSDPSFFCAPAAFAALAAFLARRKACFSS